MTWDEEVAEDEHRIFREVRERVDWNQGFISPKVAVRIDSSNVPGKGRANLAEYEKAFARLGLAYQLIVADDTPPASAAVVYDARQPYQEVRFQSAGGTLPDALKEAIPITVSEGYCVSHAWSEDGRTLLGYVYNVTNHTEVTQSLAGKYHRIPKPARLTLTVQNLPAGSLKYRLYDLNSKQVYRQGNVSGKLSVDLGDTDRDYFVLVTPS